MTSYLVDSNVIVRLLYERARLPGEITAILNDKGNHFNFSIISLWELSFKAALSNFVFKVADFDAFNEQAGWRMLVPDREIYLASTRLPWIHRDPFDRLIIMQAAALDLTVLTSDRKFESYGVSVVRG